MKFRFRIRDLIWLIVMLAGFIWIGRTQILQWHDRLDSSDAFQWRYAGGTLVAIFGGVMLMAGRSRLCATSAELTKIRLLKQDADDREFNRKIIERG